MLAATIAGVIATLVAGIIAVAHHNLEARRVHVRQFEEFHLERYWKLLDDCPYEALAYCIPCRTDVIDGDLKKACLLYLRLCESQCEMRRRGDVSDRTWNAWVERMAGWLTRWPTKQVWKEVRESPGQFNNLRELEHAYKPTEYDPCPHGEFWRWKRGLRRYREG
ncbi:hypothetical protein AB0G60_02840 [Streptomyces angustmyceticus]|uniref:Uncharacterized protein n=1 Tax=Streptomyces angustmyceticus TaxID=285578 RepID=A0A5J4L8S1_9ACTN|nr:hypothetical protein [Streptomyces angustmyceticus]UAL65599.1 hypothetical protein K7396_02810 [Streptomyces angustmyceticus]GES27880.1 hypothetical protein San01_03670 [Streptomyces angustmyceticus]